MNDNPTTTPTETPTTDEPIAYRIALAINARQRALGLSQNQLAERSHMTPGNLSRLMSAQRVPTIPVLERIAGGLNARLDITFTPHEEPQQ